MIPRIHMAIVLAALIAGCGGGNADAFVGEWTYSGVITPNCFQIEVPPLDLTGSTVTITKTDDEHLQVALDASCVVSFTVDGDKASASPSSICMLEVPTLGLSSITITSWTLTLSNGMITSQFAGAVLVCMPAGTGTLTKVPAASGS